jgi:hypothetical protein
MDPSPISNQTHAQDVPMIKTEERPRVRRTPPQLFKNNKSAYIPLQPIPAPGQQVPHPPQRVQRYKDKCARVPLQNPLKHANLPDPHKPHRFQTLRERYDTVTSVRTHALSIPPHSTRHRCTPSTPAPSNARPKKNSVSKPRSSAFHPPLYTYTHTFLKLAWHQNPACS